ncbi:hypothetical protein BDP27DRAFT_1164080, partial [Rhodocollybia butyracea]
CRRQVSRYTCPECNLPYCSSTCFKSPASLSLAHTNCSEAFYKKQIEVDIRSESSKSAEERQKMLELLKRFEEDSLDDNMPDEEEEDDDDLADRFAEVDIASASPDSLWSLLTKTEQDKFIKALHDPSGNFAQELLHSEELEKESREPWWEASPGLTEDDDIQYGTKPELITIPSSMVKPLPSGPPLIYNLCSICIAYAFITRRLATSPLSSLDPTDSDYDEARRLFGQLVPFLLDRKSTVLHTTVSDAITDIWSRFDKSTLSTSTFSVLMQDTAILLRPLAIAVTTPTHNELASHPNRTPIYVLSDIYRLFQSQSAKPSPVSHKLLFYAAHVLATPPLVMRSLADDVAVR